MTKHDSPSEFEAEAELHWLELVCQDYPEVVRDTFRVLAHNSICIEDLTVDRTAAPFSGERMFHAVARLRVPGKLDVGRLRHALEALANEMMVDLPRDGRGRGDPRPYHARGNS